MKVERKSIIRNQHNEGERPRCALCGKHGQVSFKEFLVCEDCIEYVKTSSET